MLSSSTAVVTNRKARDQYAACLPACLSSGGEVTVSREPQSYQHGHVFIARGPPCWYFCKQINNLPNSVCLMLTFYDTSSLFYLTTRIVCHFPTLLRCGCGRSITLTLLRKTSRHGVQNRKLSNTIKTLCARFDVFAAV